MDAEELTRLVTAARAGDLAAYGRLVRAMQPMVYAVALRILKDRSDALDATQETFVRALRGLARLAEAAAFPGYLRRTAIRTSQDLRRAHRNTFVDLSHMDDLPVLDEREHRWSDAQRQSLARALLVLSADERRLCDRFYHGGWSVARLALEAGVGETVIRKRLQRARDLLREQVERVEQAMIRDEVIPSDLPDRVVELLSRPRLVDLPENPVGAVLALLGRRFAEYTPTDVPEVVDVGAVRSRLECDPVYVPQEQVFRVEDGRVLRYDLTLPLLAVAVDRGSPLRLLAAGKVYRDEVVSASRLQVFHQLELLVLDEKHRIAPWAFIGSVLEAVDSVLPRSIHRILPTDYPFCTQAWDIGVEVDGEYTELLGCGVYRPDIVRLLGGDPDVHTAMGLGLGLERVAALRFGITDLRTMDLVEVAKAT